MATDEFPEEVVHALNVAVVKASRDGDITISVHTDGTEFERTLVRALEESGCFAAIWDDGHNAGFEARAGKENRVNPYRKGESV